MEVLPYSTIPLLYQIVDPADSTTYYPQAIIRDTATGTTLATKNLASVGSGRFTSTYQAPQDTNGQGRHVDITITVYTDSGHTTASDSYERRVDKYLVKASVFGSTGGGSDINYDRVQRMINESFDKIRVLLEQDSDQPLIEQLTSLKKNLQELDIKVSAIEMPKIDKPTPTDLTPILSAIEKSSQVITKKVDDKEVTEVQPPDFTPVMDKLESFPALIESIAPLLEDLKAKIPGIIEQAIQGVSKVNQDKWQKMAEAVKELSGVSPSGPAFNVPAKEKSKILSPYIK